MMRTCAVSPVMAFSASAAAQNSGVRSTPVTCTPNVAANQRAGPPIPEPMSTRRSPDASASRAAISRVPARPRPWKWSNWARVSGVTGASGPPAAWRASITRSAIPALP
jgi:hypothetical protein